MKIFDEFTTAEFYGEITELRRNEPISSAQFIAQVGFLGLCTFGGWVILGIWLLPAWFITYYCLLAIEKTVISRLPQALTKAQFGLVCLGLTFNASVFNVLPLFLWFHSSDLLKFGALAVVAGTTLNSFLTRARYPTILACYLFPNAMVFFVIALSFFDASDGLGSFITAMLIAVSIGGYFTIGLFEVHRREVKKFRTQQRLEKSQQLEAIAHLTGGISHDFNNLLGVVSGAIQLSEDTDDLEEKRALIGQAMVAIDRGSELTRQLLAMGRQSALVAEKIGTSEALKEFETFISRLFPTSITIETTVEPGTPCMEVDPSMLQNVLLNIALNAQAAMPEGGRLEIRACIASPIKTKIAEGLTASRYVQITITDTGHGIPMDIIGRVFEPYFSTGEVGKNNGIGLAMAKGLIEQSAGSISIENVEHAGARVILLIPASLEEKNAANNPTSSAPFRNDEKSVLLVDDNTELLRLIERRLENDGFQVFSFETGDEAQRAIGDGLRPAIMVSDAVMPGSIQGSELARYVKASIGNIPVILISGHIAGIDEEGFEVSAVDAFLEKPIELKELSALVSQLLLQKA